MSDGILQGLDPQAIAEHFGEVDTEYTWTAEPLPVPVCLQVASCNGAAILALEKRIAEMERKRDAAQQSRARMIDALRACKIALDEAARIGDSEWKVYAGFKTAKTLIDEVLGV